MATYTDFLNLELPAGSDYYNVGVTNANFQKLAAFLSSLSAEQVAYLNAAMDGVENVKQALDAQQVDLANKVNIEPTSVFDLPVATNVVNIARSSYGKTQLGLVICNIAVNKADSSSFSSGSVIATLPLGFRPTSTVYTLVATDSSPSGTRQSMRLRVRSTGEIDIHSVTGVDLSAVHAITGFIAFFVAV